MSKPCSVCGGNCKWVYGPFCEGTARTMAEMDGSRILAPDQLDPYTVERCADLVEGGYEKPVKTPYRADGKRSKNDLCPHNLYIYQDCEQCAAAAIRTLKGEG